MIFDKRRDTVGKIVYEVLFPMHEVDSFNGERLKRHISTIVDKTNVVIIDFSKVAYVNSSGLRELIQILRLANANDNKLFLVSLAEDIRKIFVHTNLDRLFSFYTTAQEAIDSLEG